MAINITYAVFLIGIMLILGHIFSALFMRTRVPDILPLMILGFILGPTLKLVHPDSFGQMGRVFTEIVLILIMFRTGISFRLSYLRDSFLPGIIFTLVYIAVTAAVFTFIMFYVFHLPAVYALIAAFILADNSFVVVLPLLPKLNISQNIKTILILESTFGGIINIVAALALLDMARLEAVNAHTVLGSITYSVAAASLIGVASGIFWTAALDRIRLLENSMSLTFAFILIVYALSAAVGAQGAIGVLTLGITMGNIRVMQRLWSKKINIPTQSFKGAEKDFFGEIEYIFKTLFFVFMGMSLYMQNMNFIIFGFVIASLKIILRVPVVNYFLHKNVNRRDAAVALAMCPNGLVSAVLAAAAAQQLGGESGIQDIVYSTIFFGVIMCSLLSFMIEKGRLTGMSNILFKRHAQVELPPENQPNL